MNHKRGMLPSLFLLSAATLTFEINLTRLFSVAQFYHFAFMIVSIALLGFGASGTALAIFPGLSPGVMGKGMGRLALATGGSILAAYLFTNVLPFDSFRIAWDRWQAALLAFHYLALSLPFFFSGMVVGLLLAACPATAGRIYAVNLFGSALGCILALAAPAWVGGEGTVVLCVLLSSVSYLLSAFNQQTATGRSPLLEPFFAAVMLLFSLTDLGLRLAGRPSLPLLELRLSPYKSLSYALQYPGSQLIYQRWNAFSRVDGVRSQGIHSLPGLSYRYLDLPPTEDGLLIDGDDLSPILQPGANPGFAGYLPAAAAFGLRPQAETLILDPRGGLDILVALELGASRVTAVEGNPLVISAAGPVYTHPRVELVVESGRSYLRQTGRRFDIILFSLANSYHPVRSGAYSLAEDYRYTVEAFRDALSRLKPGGLLVVTRWLQSPPSEELRAFALAVTALEEAGKDPQERIVVFRGYNTATILAKNEAINATEMRVLREFASSRAFDLIYAPGILADETNLYNILPEPVYYQAFQALLDTRPRRVFYDLYPYDVRPPTDDHPFFGHYFKWSQARQVLAELGKTWQPFGGAGYFVILALLLLAGLSAAGLVGLPALARWRMGRVNDPVPSHTTIACLGYFGLIGFAYLLIEIPLLQRFILYLGHPSYAMTAVLFSLLLFSGLGSRLADRCGGRIPIRLVLAALVSLLLLLPLALPLLFQETLGLPLSCRLAVTGLALSPAGMLMGLPFPGGIRWMVEEKRAGSLIPWSWAVNGAASVIASVLAALLALTYGFSWVFWLGALCYAGALMVMSFSR